jgi:hypothetical protein
VPTPPLTAAQLAAKVREWIIANDDAGPSAWWLRPDHTHELLADLDRMAATAHADEAPTQKLPPIGETVRRRPPVPPAVRELKGPELLRALADELDRDGLSIADLDTEDDDL